jgi:peptidyl-prolyl cis-trans isomerase C
MHIKRLSLALVTALGVGQAFAADPAPKTLVIVNGQGVNEYHFSMYAKEFIKNPQEFNKNPEAQVKLLNELITTIAIAQSAEAGGLAEQPSVKAQLDISRARILTQNALQQFWRENPVSDDDLKKAYDELTATEAEKEYKARHILLKTEDEAKAVIEELKGGADFASLAKEKSIGPSGKNGGDLGWFGGAQMVAPFSKAVAALEDGKFTTAPVQTQFGWHVILREESRSKAPPSFEDAKTALTANLRRKKAEEFVANIREKSQIEMKEPPPASTEDAATSPN